MTRRAVLPFSTLMIRAATVVAMVASAAALVGCGNATVEPAPSVANGGSSGGTIIVTTTVEASAGSSPARPLVPPAVRRVDLASGSLVWEAAASGALGTATMLVEGDGVVVAINDRCGAPEAAAFAAESGVLLAPLAEARVLAIDPLVHRIALVEGLVVLPAGDGVEPAGVAAWAVDGSGEHWFADSPGLVAMDATSDPVITLSNHPGAGSRLRRLDRRDGSTVWTAGLDHDATWTVVTEASVIVGRAATAVVPAEVVAFDLDDGSELWRRPLAPGSDRVTVESAGWTVIGVDPATGVTVAVDAGTGDERWRTDLRLPQRGEDEVGKRIVDGDTVYLESDVGVHALDMSSGTQRWQRSGVGLGTGSVPSVTGAGAGTVLVDGVLLNAVDGAELARITPDTVAELVGDEPNTRLVVARRGAYLLSNCPGAS